MLLSLLVENYCSLLMKYMLNMKRKNK